ncbi:hypothetical protein BYT27DRAFT_7212818 [Phlegmacium glaucopus]|nr:hypothetical protein BYT27DRAFT_7212818 [Phlegmacium glaucopus]
MNSGEQPNGDDLDLDKNTSTHLQRPFEPFHPTKDGMIIIILLIVIVIGAVVGGVVGGTTSALAAQLRKATAPIIETMTTTVITTTTPTTTTLGALAPMPSNCVWEGTGPSCNATCQQGFTTIAASRCGNDTSLATCCTTGSKFFCCEAEPITVPLPSGINP